MQDELLGNAGDANGSPSFTAVFHARVGVDVVHEDLDVLRFHFGYLLWVCENGNRVHGANQHPTCERLWQVLLNAFFDYPSRLIRHP